MQRHFSPAFLITVAVALCAGVASAGTLPASGCVGGSYPCFGVYVERPGGTASDTYSETSTAPLSHSILSSSIVTGSAYAAASIGRLGARSDLQWAGQPSSPEARAFADFSDASNVFNPNTIPVYLGVDFAINGTIVTSGDGVARVQGTLALLDVDDASHGVDTLTAPGTTTVTVVLTPGWNSLMVSGHLETDSYLLSGTGGADVDFLHTFSITGARLENSIGQSLGDVPLVDLNGASLLPEPAFAGLVTAGLLVLALRRS